MQLRVDLLMPNGKVLGRFVLDTDEIPDDTFAIDSFVQAYGVTIGPVPVQVQIRRIL